MTTREQLTDLVVRARDRDGAMRLLEALGFACEPLEVPPRAWSGWGLAGVADLAALVVAGRSGTLDALLLEVRDGTAPDRLAWMARKVRSRNESRLHLFVFATPAYARIVLGTFDLEGAYRSLALEPGSVRESDAEALEEMAARDGETGLELALRQARALDRTRVTRQFFREFRSRRASVAGAWIGIPPAAGPERGRLALLFLCRLTFLYFIQRRRALAGDERYLARLFGEWAARPAGGAGSFYRARLVPLFFGALNRPAGERDAAARSLGDVPYLNGGLFEPTPLERGFPALDLPDDEVRGALDGLLERYRFTTREGGPDSPFSVDPEILGRVFEGLMAPDQRGETGSFYTPAPVVDRVVREAVEAYVVDACDADAAAAVARGEGGLLPADVRHRVRGRLERVRVLDPACGSGAFLLGALGRLAGALEGLGVAPCESRRRVVARSLHGVDLLDDAALLCSLRLWLALSAGEGGGDGPGAVRPLPNLDRLIRQGDALIDPLDLGGPLDDAGAGPVFQPLRDAATRRALRALEPASRRYLESGPRERDALRAELAAAERRLAGRWIEGARRMEEARSRMLRARSRDRDLFGDVPDEARRAARGLRAVEDRLSELDRLRTTLEERGALPFFSFGVHFADAGHGFDLILSNPPWIRAHRWPARLRRLAARRFEVCRAPGWPGGAELAGVAPGVGAQVDLSILFVERALRLLAPGGVLAMLVPAKALRALYGGAVRRMLLRDLDLSCIEDHALDHRALFRADAFAAVLIGRRRGAGAVPADGASGAGRVRIRLARPGGRALDFEATARDLPLFPDDPASPWVVVPPDVREAMRAMQAAGPPLGRHAGLRVARGVMTGANDVLVVRAAALKLGGLARIEAEGHARGRGAGRGRGGEGPAPAPAGRYRAYVETAALRPLVRGAGIDAFSYRTGGYVVWCHDGDGRPVHPPPRMQRYLARHRHALERRPGWRAPRPLGMVFRLSAGTLRPKVAWHDLSDTLRAVALPARVTVDGVDRELVPLNTVYFVPTTDPGDATLLAGWLNALPTRVFARGIAERAKDARFRFFAWTIACIPLPLGWRHAPAADRVRRISAAAHEARGISGEDQARLDRAVADLYRLEPRHVDALRGFDRWLAGEP